ncbi:MAG: hypothetical protein IPP79_11935 [Chitinophagaceae bacterium]|nr:hypothetical protein [Chitinophagaceae bacterium]
MKITLITALILLLLIPVAFIGCTKGENDPKTSKYCLVTKWYAQGDTSQTSTKFSYDIQDRLIFWDGPGPVDNTIEYGNKSITIRAVAPYSGNYSIYYLNDDTTTNYSVTYNGGIVLDSTLYFYDASKFLIKSVRYTDAFGKDSVIMTYSNENLAKIVIYNSNGTAPQATFDYYTDSSKSWVYQNIGPYNNNGLYLPWLGRSNKNLIKSYSSDFNGNPEPITITYQKNTDGYVTKYIMNFMGTSDNHFLEYKCK